MYLSNTNQKLEIVLAGTITTNPLRWTTSYQDITSAGMTLPQASDQNTTNNTTPVTIVPVPPAVGTNRQVVLITVFNTDTVAATVTIQKDVAGTKYQLTKALLQVGDSLMWSREAGWTINKQSDQESVIITEFTANGTWTKPTGLKRVLVCCVGAGGGGGSGRCDGATTNRFGGGGGGGGAIVWRQIASQDIATSTVAVTVGTGGIGGAGVSTVATNGNNGTTGGDTSFGALVIAKGGNFGSGGTGTVGSGGTGGQSFSCTPLYGPYALNGASGSSGATGAGAQGGAGFGGGTAAPGGGGGGGITSAGVNATSAGTGGSVYANGLLILGPNSGASPNGVANQSNFLFFGSTLTSGKGLGTGGAGGYPSLPANAGNGGDYGAGGGGGRASLTGTTSGAGGNGGGGLCLVMEIY